MNLMKKIATLVVFIGLAFLHISSLKSIPGTFSDEALVGVQAHQILQGDWSGFINPFFNYHERYVIGALPVYMTAPFVALFGLNDFSIRFAPAVFGLLSLIVLYGLMGKLKLGWFPKIYSVLLYSLSPVFFHISHTNFGHSFSLFFLLSGYYFYLSSKERLSGLLFGVSVYGYLAFSIAVFIPLSGIVISEVCRIRSNLKKYATLAVLLSSFTVTSIPQIYTVLTRPGFTKRLIDKNSGNNGFFTTQKLKDIIKLYPRYYSDQVLIKTAEVDLPGGFISRHSVRGHGLFLPVSLTLILLATTNFILSGNNYHRFFPFFWLLLLYPLPDLLTARENYPPYPFALYSTVYLLPFISAFALDRWGKIFRKHKLFLSTTATILLVITLSQAADFLIDYQTYRLYSADYWGWQYGPKEIVKYFIDHQSEYDGLFLHTKFNGPEALIPFYDPERKCTKCELGGIEKYSVNKKQLFAFRNGEDIKSLAAYPELKLVFVSQKKIYLPNGFAEYTIGQFKPL